MNTVENPPNPLFKGELSRFCLFKGENNIPKTGEQTHVSG